MNEQRFSKAPISVEPKSTSIIKKSELSSVTEEISEQAHLLDELTQKLFGALDNILRKEPPSPAMNKAIERKYSSDAAYALAINVDKLVEVNDRVRRILSLLEN